MNQNVYKILLIKHIKDIICELESWDNEHNIEITKGTQLNYKKYDSKELIPIKTIKINRDSDYHKDFSLYLYDNNSQLIAIIMDLNKESIELLELIIENF